MYSASSAAEHQTAAVSVHMEASLQSPMGQITQKLLLLRNQILSKTKDSSELLATADCTYNLLVALLELCNDPYHNVIQSAESISLLVLAYQLLNQIFEYLKLLYEARVAENYTTGVFDDRCARILTHSSYDKATRANHSSEVLAILFGWLLNHKGRAFPTADEKKELCHKTQLTLVQVNDWFVNARRRYLNQKSPVSSRGASALLLNPIYTSSSNSSVTRNDNVNTNSSFFKNNKQNIE
ncbi:hypothetical protein BDF19DRAFT_78672 [Syncephalis fuscata]|nr:hypothetical protein BDF19DRAFT_78672 [Syncephalis fuscata]